MNSKYRNYLQRYCSLIVLLLLISTGNLFAQSNFSISGIVKDNKGLTLPGATVFLSGTKVIGSTDKNGKYLFKDLLPGAYTIVTKYLGFETASYAVTLIDGPLTQNMTLKESTGQLQQVVITGDPNWGKRFEEFKKRFFGSTPNASTCKILNKEVLHFKMDKEKNTLMATADDFLEIINEGLGYKIKYLLEDFKFDTKNGVLFYQGYPSFSDLKPKDKKQEESWKKNRSNAYNGSINHLIKSMYNHDAINQGFRMYATDYDFNKPLDDDGNEKMITIDNQLVLIDSLIADGDGNFKVLSFKKTLFIVYVNGRESFNYKNSGYMLRRPYGSNVASGEYSMMSLLENDVLIDAHGNYNPPGGLAFKGHMAWEQVAELTPLEAEVLHP